MENIKLNESKFQKLQIKDENDNKERGEISTLIKNTQPEMSEERSRWIANLPKPPVPPLALTLERYLSGLEAVLPKSQYTETCLLVKEFGKSNGQGEKLQKLLQDYANSTDNWITDIWLEDMYLENPIALPINSNPFFLLPIQHFRSISEQIHFAAAFVHFSLEFKKQTRDQTLSQDVGKGQKTGQALCMQTYRHFFTACRIPGTPRDVQKILPQAKGHFIVAAFNQFFEVKLSETADPKAIPSFDHIAATLHRIWELAKDTQNQHSIGLLTTQNRRQWASDRVELLQDKNNENFLKSIEESLFILCLDDFCPPSTFPPIRAGFCNSISAAKLDLSYMGAMLLHGGGSCVHTSNRWFDKFLQIIVSRSGICGLLVEHSVSEGVTVIRYLELFWQHYRKCWPTFRRQNTIDMRQNIPPKVDALEFRKLAFEVSEKIQKQVKIAAKSIDRHISDVDFHVLKFDDFGTERIKKAKISPDVFIQLALQLTFYKLHRKCISTYESCSLRQFGRGRVDNIRASHQAALDWAKAMCTSEKPDERTKLNNFKRAINKQTEVLKYTAAGLGPDNHLIALRKMSEVYENTIPALFKEKSFKEYINFRLSTSQLVSCEDMLVGYGPVVPDGYGVCYLPRGDLIYFCISSFVSSPETSSSEFFGKTIESSLNQMNELSQKLNDSTSS